MILCHSAHKSIMDESNNNVDFYQARKNMVLNILEDTDKPKPLAQLKDLFKYKYGQEMPFSDISDNAIHDWLSKLENVGFEVIKNERSYYFKKVLDPVPTAVNDNKRKTSSPIVSQTAKRSRSAPGNEEPTSNLRRSNTTRQPRVVKFKEDVTATPVKSRSKSEHRPSMIIGAPNMYGSLLIGDDFLLGMAIYKLGFKATKMRGKLQSGLCVSGMRIIDAAKIIHELDDDRHKTAILYVGSIDIATGRELIEMMQDMTELMRACAEKNIRPVFCTLASLPNFVLGNRKDTLIGFNKYLQSNPFGIPVIDLHKCFKFEQQEDFSPIFFMDYPRYVSGFNRQLFLWSKDGRERVHNMLMKNLGMALMASDNTTFGYI